MTSLVDGGALYALLARYALARYLVFFALCDSLVYGRASVTGAAGPAAFANGRVQLVTLDQPGCFPVQPTSQ